MQNIDVQISKAQLKQFLVEFEDDLPYVTATIDLYTANNKKISSFCTSTRTYYTQHFDLPIEMITPIMDIAKKIESIVTNACKREMALLPV